MKPKERAKEITYRYLGVGMMIRQAKKYALICVDEIIRDNENYRKHINNWKESNKYWQEVKHEIEKL